MRRIIFGILGCTVVSVFAATQYLNYNAGTPLPTGRFRWDEFGNAGLVELGKSSPDFARLEGDSLVGNFWIQTVGWAVFDNDAKIVPPPTKVTDLWGVVGSATSPNAGKIRLSGPNTSLKFNPLTQRLEGYGWNNALGKIPLGDVSDELADTGAAFIGRVKIIGNTTGKSIYSTTYTQGDVFDATLFNTALQSVRKNVSLLVRNLNDSDKNISFTTNNTVNNQISFINTSNTSLTKRYSTLPDSLFGPVRTIIIIGGDFVIDRDMLNDSGRPRSLIVLQNDQGVGGNIYVTENVKKIESSLFAQKTLYSGNGPDALYNNVMSKIPFLPQSQLWIRGSLISRNTIGGAAKGGNVVCPYNTDCNFEKALQYDLNYFRDYRKKDIYRAYKNNELDAYSMIIEYDGRVLSDPPPGW